MRNLKSKIPYIIGYVILAAFISLGIYSIVTARHEIKVNEIELRDVNKELQTLESKHDAQGKELEQRNEEKKKLEEEKARLESELQAKIEAKEKLAQAAKLQPAVAAATTSVPSGSCHDWMAAAGITDINNAYWLIMKESGCNPNAVNKSSGACGIGQQLPCGKWAHTWNEPVGAMIDMQGYVMARYGSWANAVAHSQAKGWY